MKKILSIVVLASSILLSSTNPWGGISVSTADNLDATSMNPAGYGIDRGEQSGFFIPINEDNPFSIHSAARGDGWGYSLFYVENDEIFNPSDGSIGFGTKIFKNTYLGISWNKYHTLSIGGLLRPFNFLSFGDNLTVSEELDYIHSYRAGLSFRPFLKHRLTVGSDVMFTNNGDDSFSKATILPFASIQPVDGISLSFSGMLDENNKFEDMNINLSLNVGHGGGYISSSDNQLGIGFTTFEQQDESIFNIKKKNHKNYVRMKLEGSFIEEKPRKVFGFDFSSILPFSSPQRRGTQLRTWLDEINELTESNDVDGLIIDMGSVSAGFAKRNAMRRALQSFKDSGKKIIVFAEYGISNMSYFLISMADEIYMPQMTDVQLKGLGANISFYRGLLDTLSIVPEVFRVNYDGKSYKTAGDSFLNHKMSDEMRENYSELFEDLYAVFVNGISEGRGWEAEHTKDIINNGPYIITQDAIDAGLVTSTMYPDEFEEYVDALNDKKSTITNWNDIDRSDEYVHEWAPKEKDKIAVIYAVGGIQSGKSNPGPGGSTVMGDKTLMKAIKSAREDKSVKAIVLRIDSGGGSALASDHMWSEIIKTTKTDTSNVKPFIASMSDVAASGGYYIACEADSILADEATITGSIGVIGFRMNFSQLKKRIGINQERLSFGENSNFMSSGRLINDDEYERLQGAIDDVYNRFKTRVIEGRDNLTENDDLDDVALGRVFSGKRASELSLTLVDKLGGLHEAIEVAKNSAKIVGDVEIVEYPRKTNEGLHEFKKHFGGNVEQQITDFLPEAIRSDWEYLRSIEGLMDENTLMILPYKIEID
ncbi:MAG: signal peptide peptidase SppA [Candidatus Marinimicrobia bacterium]|nr:signal peptide peptidase SppA [Candidatus Neomarinimicrobiota bacterium]